MKAAIVKSATLKALVSSLVLLGGLSQVVHAEDANPNLVLAGTALEGNLTGNIGVYSKYILRGITQTYGTTYDGSGPEQDTPALQGGVDYVLKNGFYAGYWFSTLGYNAASFNPSSNNKHSTQNSVESDIYGGYTGTIGSTGIGYTVGGTVYVYNPGWASTGYETKLGLSYGEVAFTAQTLLNDVTWGNSKDTYLLATWTHALPKDFTFVGQVGAYYYGEHGEFFNSDNPADGSFMQGFQNVDGSPSTTDKAKTFAFRHVTLGVTHALPFKGGTWGMQYIVGGQNRFGVRQDNQIVGSLGMTF